MAWTASSKGEEDCFVHGSPVPKEQGPDLTGAGVGREKCALEEAGIGSELDQLQWLQVPIESSSHVTKPCGTSFALTPSPLTVHEDVQIQFAEVGLLIHGDRECWVACAAH